MSGQVVRVAGWHASDPGSILSRDVYPQRCEHFRVDYVRYIKVLISFHFHFDNIRDLPMIKQI
jgi:hypothetical protein